MDNLIGDVTLTFKSLSEERPPLCVTLRDRILGTRAYIVRKQSAHVLVASSDGQRFMVARLDTWDADTQSEHSYWREKGSGALLGDFAEWPTWTYLPLPDPNTERRVYYVDLYDGSDANDGLSSGSPLATVAQAQIHASGNTHDLIIIMDELWRSVPVRK